MLKTTDKNFEGVGIMFRCNEKDILSDNKKCCSSKNAFWTDDKIKEFIQMNPRIGEKTYSFIQNRIKEYKEYVSEKNLFESGQHTYAPLPNYLDILESEIHNKGLFTKVKLFTNTILGVSHIKLDENNLIRTPLGGFINHCSKNPSVVMRKGTEKIFSKDIEYYNFILVRDVEDGEELTINYLDTPCLNKI